MLYAPSFVIHIRLYRLQKTLSKGIIQYELLSASVCSYQLVDNLLENITSIDILFRLHSFSTLQSQIRAGKFDHDCVQFKGFESTSLGVE